MKKYTLYPQCQNADCTIAELPRQLEDLDLKPEELQRDEVATDTWGSWVILSIILGIRLGPFTWSKQKDSYEVFRDGKKLQVSKKNIDSLQRITHIEKFNGGILRLPKHEDLENLHWAQAEQHYGTPTIDISGLDVHELKSKYLRFYNERYLDYKLRIDLYGNDLEQLTKKQETFLFRTVLNNGNEMNGQQKRNPTVSKIASIIRQNARLNPIDIMTEGEYFGFKNPKMEYDLLLAECYHWLLNGVNAQPTSNGLDEMYDDYKLEDDISLVHSYNHKYQKKINLEVKVNEVLDLMLVIIKDKQYQPEVKKSLFRSLFMFCWLHLTEFGSQTKFPYKKDLKKKFFTGHSEMIDVSKLNGAPKSAFGDALVTGNTASNKLKCRFWRKYLGWKEDHNYDEN